VTPNVQFVSKAFPQAETFMWFDIGTIPKNDVELQLDERLCHLPFNRTAICGRDAEGWHFGLACLSGEKSVTVGGVGFDGNNWHVFKPFAWADTADGIALMPQSGYELPSRTECLRSMAIVHLMLCGLENRAMDSYQPVVENTFINEKRKRKGKQPLISWRTVVVAPLKLPTGPNLGGTHASPRKHDRRGHWRQCASGKRVWVRQAVVGDAARGLVMKDYIVRGKT